MRKGADEISNRIPLAARKPRSFRGVVNTSVQELTAQELTQVRVTSWWVVSGKNKATRLKRLDRPVEGSAHGHHPAPGPREKVEMSS